MVITFFLPLFSLLDFFHMIDGNNRKLHLDEVLIEALRHGYFCKLSVVMRKSCLVKNFKTGTSCTPWNQNGCKFERVVKGPICPIFECEHVISLNFFSPHISHFRSPTSSIWRWQISGRQGDAFLQFFFNFLSHAKNLFQTAQNPATASTRQAGQ